jgi:hypothetical protein
MKAITNRFQNLPMQPAICIALLPALMEELEAVDWWNQPVDACKDAELKAILEHNRDEEKEHAAMVLEWIRRKDPRMDKELKDYLFTDKPITHL